jgi:glycine dehydrogenase subunit 2
MNAPQSPQSLWPLRTRLSLEGSTAGHTGFSATPNDVPAAPAPREDLARSGRVGLPEMSELSAVRHFTRLSTLNYSIDGGMYPLGSCTMKYNPRINEAAASLPAFTRLHPETPSTLVQGALELMYRLENALAEISGFARVSLQPAAGAMGEYTGIAMIRACLKARGDVRRKILIPESAHGTNCATATLCGYEVVPVHVTERGIIDPAEIEALTRSGDVAGLMVTNPNTCGLFEENIIKIVDIIHERGGLVYCDGANMNAMLGITRPGDAGFDVMHFNLHKTFTTPHGGGGPGCGAVGVSKTLVPYLPAPMVEKDANSGLFVLDENRPESIGRVKDYYGHFLMMVRAYTYIRELGPEGVRKAGEDAILLANYVRMRLREAYEVAYDRPCMHEVVLSDKKQQAHGVKTLDIAKRLIDLGYHPPTVYFPLLIPGAIMIEPTETETLDSVEAFCATMLQVAQEAREENGFEKHFKDAPRHMPFARVNETKAARDLILSWKDL